MNRKAFTLVEIMIVVAIIALLATIALPGLLRTRLTANESNAIATLRTLATSVETFRTSQTAPTYPTTGIATDLQGATPPYVTGFTMTGEVGAKAGYNFSVLGNANSYSAIANPVTAGTTGNRRFCIDETGIMRSQAADYTVSATTDCTGTALS